MLANFELALRAIVYVGKKCFEMMQAQLQSRWLDTSLDSWTVELVRELCDGIADDSWKVEATLATRTEDVHAQQELLKQALAASDRVNALNSGRIKDNLADIEVLRQIFEEDEDTFRITLQRRQLLDLRDKTSTWEELSGKLSVTLDLETNARPDVVDDNESIEESWQFDVMDDDEQSNTRSKNIGRDTNANSGGILALPQFLDRSHLVVASHEAAEGRFENLETLFLRHAEVLSCHRMTILSQVPILAPVADYVHMLPQVDVALHEERFQPGKSWGGMLDWSEHPNITLMLNEEKRINPPSAYEVAAWYRKRVNQFDDSGQLDSALILVQYGASQGVPDLDALGEELSLLSKLVYGSPNRHEDTAADEISKVEGTNDWSLTRWRLSSETEIVRAYLDKSTTASIPDDLRRLVLPYLYVQESRLEREGHPDPSLHDRLLFDWILDTACSRLDLICAVFQSSKPTLDYGQRLIKSDKQLATLAIACVYGYIGVSSWDIMSSIFDCLPAFNEEDVTVHAQETLSAILYATHSSSLPMPRQIYAALSSFSTTALSQALDGFDLHLEAAEIFSRWSSPMPLRFFVTLADDVKLQRAWAERLAKTSAAAVQKSPVAGGNKLGQDFEYEDEWISLLDDLSTLAGKDDYEEREPKPAFARLTKVELIKIFFGGLLSSGSKFEMCRDLQALITFPKNLRLLGVCSTLPRAKGLLIQLQNKN